MNWIITHIPPWVWLALVFHGLTLGTVAYLILLERKTASWVQDRIGPNRVGFDFGLPFLGFLKGMKGFGQPLADGLKFLLKEDYRPGGVDKVLFTVAPCIMIFTVIISIAVIPWGGTVRTTKEVALPEEQALALMGRTLHIPSQDPETTELYEQFYAHQVLAGVRDIAIRGPERPSTQPATAVAGDTSTPPTTAVANATIDTTTTLTYRWDFQIASLNIGVLYIIAVLSLTIYGVVVGGWASNNKYSFLGGLRATANMISYEIPLGLSILCIVLMFGSLDLSEIVEKQAHYWVGFVPAWNVFTQPLTFLIFLICIHAEANRAPFDLAEAEQELVGGYHTEYSSMRFALFFLAEYLGMITTSAVCVALFFGGWHFPGLGGGVDQSNAAVTDSVLIAILRAAVFFVKTLLIVFVFMWVRWSLPRFRFDQLMDIAWRALIPMSLALTMLTAVIVWALGGRTLDRVHGAEGIWFFIMNCVVLLITLGVSRILPAPPPTNRRIKVVGSRFSQPTAATGSAA